MFPRALEAAGVHALQVGVRVSFTRSSNQLETSPHTESRPTASSRWHCLKALTLSQQRGLLRTFEKRKLRDRSRTLQQILWRFWRLMAAFMMQKTACNHFRLLKGTPFCRTKELPEACTLRCWEHLSFPAYCRPAKLSRKMKTLKAQRLYTYFVKGWNYLVRSAKEP